MKRPSSTSSSERAEAPQPAREARIILGRGALFVAIFACLVAVLNERFEAGDDGPAAQLFEEVIERRVDADVVVLGASEMDRGVDARVFADHGVELFNFAQRAASPAYFATWYRSLFREYYGRPKVAIIGTPWYLFDPRLDHPYELDSAHLPLREFVAAFLDGDLSRSLLIKGRFPIIRDRKSYERLFALGHAAAEGPARPTRSRRGLGDRLEVSEIDATVDPERRAAFEELVAGLVADGIRVVFVEPPIYLPGVRPDRECGVPVRELARRFDIPIFDYNDDRRSELNYDVSSFHDSVHLNWYGSRRFSERLARDLEPILREAGVIESMDRRDG